MAQGIIANQIFLFYSKHFSYKIKLDYFSSFYFHVNPPYKEKNKQTKHPQQNQTLLITLKHKCLNNKAEYV
jgi:hypothetical protein